jgi:hypothetical protein
VAVACCAAAPARAQDALSGDTLTIEVVTFGRGDQVNSYFGHNAFVVRGPQLTAPLVFNYGMFTFDPDMIPRFLRGRLTFWVGVGDFERAAASYVAENRDVRLRTLNLEPEQRVAIARQLSHDVQPEHSHYLYDHYFDNCSTRVRDVLDRALHGQLRRAWSAPGKFTLRQETQRYTEHDLVTEWLMMFGLNDQVDRPLRQWDEAFLPDELERMLDGASYLSAQGERVSLVASRRDYFLARRPPPPAAASVRWPHALGLGVLLGLGALALAWRARRAFLVAAASFGLCAGALGALSTSLWAFSDHLVAHHNENLFLANPVTLLGGLAGVIAWLGSARAERAMAFIYAALGASTLLLLALHAIVPGFDQDISLTATLLAPINLGLALGSLKLGLRTAGSARAGDPTAASAAGTQLST